MLRNKDRWVKTILKKFDQNFDKNRERRAIFGRRGSDVRVYSRLKRVEELIAFSAALNSIKDEDGGELYGRYMGMLSQHGVFQRLAVVYKKRRNEERAYFAYFISQHPININELLISLVEDSNIYCRVNVLKALCSIGDMHGVEAILQFFDDRRIFVHHMLLAEDLYSFAGDKEALALRLWRNHSIWGGNIVLGVISFITMFSDRFKEAFLPVLQNQLLAAEVRIGVIHYYSKFFFQPAQPVLIQYLAQTDNYHIAIESAAALRMYPGKATTQALVAALNSEDWHVRHSAASSLVALGEYMAGIGCNVESKDCEAVGMMQYALAQSEARVLAQSEAGALAAQTKDMIVSDIAV